MISNTAVLHLVNLLSFSTGYDLLDEAHEKMALEDLPKVHMLKDEHGNFHLKNLSKKCYDATRGGCYLCLSLVFGPCLACCAGIHFACLAFQVSYFQYEGLRSVYRMHT